MSEHTPLRIGVSDARWLFLDGHALAEPPSGGRSPTAALKMIKRLGFVQLDSINIVERAHHHILWTRLPEYQPVFLDRLQQSGRIFEHWTHDASLIPSDWFPHWRHRFDRVSWGSWLQTRIGADHQRVVLTTVDRIRREGPLCARDFEQTGIRSGKWWDWKPAKAALEFAWRKGLLAIPRRERFEKIYDLTERVLPDLHHLPAPSLEEHVDWACSEALKRLGVATARQLAGFFNTLTPAQATAWAQRGVAEGKLVTAALDGMPRAQARLFFAPQDWKRRVAAIKSRAERWTTEVRLLSPFDPVVRDRSRCASLFGFQYRFEAFVPEDKRKYGYYVLPIMRGDRFIGRLDPKLDRENGSLHIRRIWWEPGFALNARTRGALRETIERYAGFNGATKVEMKRL